MGNLVHKQYLVPANAQNIADHRFQLVRLLHTIAGNIIVQQRAVLYHTIAQTGSKCRFAALQPVFGNGTLEASVGPGVGPLHLHQYLQGSIPGSKFLSFTHFPISTG